MKTTPRRITGPLKSRVNRLSHAKAQRFALDEQARLMAELRRLADSGSGIDELHAYLDSLEQAMTGTGERR